MEAVAVSAPFQPTIVPSSVSYTKLAAALSAGTTKLDVPFQKIPVGAEVPLELLSPRVGVGKGIVTCGSAAIGAPVPSTRNERPVLLLLTQNGPPGGEARPQAFCRLALVLGATPGWLEIRLVWT